jgi:hypothetical protein
MALPRNADPRRQQFFTLSFDHTLPALTANVAAVAATASFVCETDANMADSDYIAIGDGSLNPPLSFEYDKTGDGVTGGRVAVTAGTTAISVATNFVTAINAAQLAVTASNVGGTSATVTLTHDIAGVIGNAATLTENVTAAGFTVSGATFTGGTAATAASLSLAETASRTIQLLTAQRAMRIDKVEYVNPTGLAGHASNYWEIALKKGSTVMAQWSTDSDVVGQGTLTADTIVNPALSATDANLVAAPGDVLKLALTKAASAANLPPGRIVIHGRYV